jgi:amino acid adenylation domain-containing protein
MATSIALKVMASVLGLPPQSLNQSASFISCGGDSMTALRFAAECRQYGILISVDTVLSSPTLQHLLQICRAADLSETSCVGTPSDTPNEDGREQPSISNGGSESSSYEIVSSRSAESFNADAEVHIHHTEVHIGLFPQQDDNLEKHSMPPEDDLSLISVETEDLCNPREATMDQITDLSTSQISLMHGSLETPGANIISYYETYFPAQMPRIKAAWHEVIKMEPIFRTIYRSPEDGCSILPKLHWREFKTTKAKTYRDTLSGGQTQVHSWPNTSTAIDLDVKFTVVHYQAEAEADSRSILIWSVHHALIDGWSAALVLKKVIQAAGGETVQPGPPFSDVARALNQWTLTHKAEGDAFWAEQQAKLSEGREELLFPVVGKGNAGECQQEDIRITLGHHYTSLKGAARACGVTPTTFFYAAWALCLGMYADADNVIIGTVVSGRNIPLQGVLDTVGPIVSTLPFQVDIVWDMNARDFVRDVFNRMQRLVQYSWTTPDNGFSRVRGQLLAIQPDAQWRADNDEFVVDRSFARQSTNLPLSMIVTDSGSIMLQYSRQRYRHRDMEGVGRTLKQVLISLCQPDNTLDVCTSGILSASELVALRSMGNCNSSTTTKPSIRDDLVTLFERTARKYPSAMAIERADQQITYTELEKLSGRISRILRDKIDPEELVAVHADGSVNWIISTYAVLRAGGTYCPLDKAHHQEYRDSLFETSTARFFLATTSEAIACKPRTALFAYDVESILLEPESDPDLSGIAPRSQPRPWERAYVCFTSGSTGKSKGVVCTHQGLVAFQRDFEVRLRATVGTRVAQVMSPAFDGSIHEVFSALSYGATLVLRPEGGAFGHLRTVESALLTPSIASVLNPDDLPQLKTVYLVGEAVPQAVCNAWASRTVLYNMYGPTEATCGATIKRLHAGQPVTIGGPNPSTRIYILDHREQLAPMGRIGEIYLAGVQVAQGYIGRPELNAERFLPDSICSGLGEYMYRTGDRGYWNDAGEIIFLGRVDRQIKLQGFRIDLEDLEARVLGACKGAHAVAITRRKDDLVCTVQTPSSDVTAMRTAIRTAVPAFAVPTYIYAVAQLPMTATGKIDYKAIAESVDVAQQREVFFGTETESLVAATWRQVLNLGSHDAAIIGPRSSFIDLGGHSLQQLRLAARLTAVFGERITVQMIARLATLRDLAGTIDKMKEGRSSPAAGSLQSGHHGEYKLSPMEEEWWRKYQLDCSSSAFNVTYVAQYNPDTVSQSRLINAWNLVLSRHDAFRSRYLQRGKRKNSVVRILAPDPPRVDKLRSVNVRVEVNRPFNLACAPPVRVTITRDTIVAVWSHIICDYTALGTVLNEVAAAYHCKPLPPPVQPHYIRLVAGAASPPPCHLNFWSEYLGDVQGSCPAYLGNGARRTSYRGKSSVARISSSLWRRMQTQAAESDVTMQQFILAAVAMAVSASDEADLPLDLRLGVPFINRHSEAEMNAVGLFLEPLPVRVLFGDRNKNVEQPSSPETALSLAGYLAAVQRSCQDSLSYAVPWHALLTHLGIDAQEELPDHPLMDCVVSFHDARRTPTEKVPAQSVATGDTKEGGPWSLFALGDGVEPQYVWSEGSKFMLMVECMAVDDDTLLLRLEYDTACYVKGSGRIAAVRAVILRALDGLASGEKLHRDDSFGELREELRGLWDAEKGGGFAARGNGVDGRLLGEQEVGFQESLSALCV